MPWIVWSAAVPSLSGITEIDVEHTGVRNSICCFAVCGEVLVDPGPEVSHRTLLAKLGDVRPRAVLLTHIHLDHAGATGALVRKWPDLQVYVHERGAPHVIDPSKLVASATRIYGDDMPRLWGEIVAVPEENVHVLGGAGGDAGPGWRWTYAPGHASHHVLYLHEETGVAFTGDVAGIRIAEGPVFPPTPPPDIDLDAWRASLDALEGWRPEALALTHFGLHEDVAPHIAAMREGLDRWGAFARDNGADAYVDAVRTFVAQHTEEPGTRAAYESANPPETLWGGLHRYWEKRVPSG
jgi:glyoxylase-like metal-dependent hydrolase (beta-lactamase superfamily II)